MKESFKEQVRRMLYNNIVPNPYMYREGFEPVRDYGLNRYTLANSFMNRMPNINNPVVRQYLNNQYLANESRYNPNFYNSFGE